MIRSMDRGTFGENAAADFLRRKGFKILERNWRFHPYEIDIIAGENGMLVFVEVKTRRHSSRIGGYAAATSRRKKLALRRACLAYLDRRTHRPMTYRFDIVEILTENSVSTNRTIYHFINVPLFDRFD